MYFANIRKDTIGHSRAGTHEGNGLIVSLSRSLAAAWQLPPGGATAKSSSSLGPLEARTITARILVNKSWYNYNQEEKQELDPQQA